MPTIHTFPSSAAAYDASQTHDEIKDGDVLHVPSEGVVGVITEAWPIAVTQAHGEFHTLALGTDWSCIPLVMGGTRDYRESFLLAFGRALDSHVAVI